MRKATSNPTTTLFIVNFDTHRVHSRDVERHFEEFGRLRRVEIKKNYAFVQVGEERRGESASPGWGWQDCPPVTMPEDHPREIRQSSKWQGSKKHEAWVVCVCLCVCLKCVDGPATSLGLSQTK